MLSRTVRIAFSFILLGFLGSGIAHQSYASGKYSKNHQVILKRANQFLLEASDWAITDGVSEYYKHDKNQKWIQDKMGAEWAVTTDSGPVIYSDDFNVRFIIKAAGIYYEILSLAEFQKNPLYEYWVVKKSGDLGNRCRFLITKSESRTSKRTIVYRSHQFFDAYKLPNNEILVLDTENLENLYRLAPWYYPECYKYSDLKNYKINVNRSGEYSRVKIR